MAGAWRFLSTRPSAASCVSEASNSDSESELGPLTPWAAPEPWAEPEPWAAPDPLAPEMCSTSELGAAPPPRVGPGTCAEVSTDVTVVPGAVELTSAPTSLTGTDVATACTGGTEGVATAGVVTADTAAAGVLVLVSNVG